jgi:hypothetical protein
MAYTRTTSGHAAASFSTAFLILVVMAFGGCASSGQSSDGGNDEGPTLTIEQVENRLQQQGLGTTSGGYLDDPGFARQALRLRTDRGDDIVVYEYGSSSAAEMELTRKSPSAGTPPFYYQQGNILAIQYGTNGQVRSALEAVLGPRE